jgi:hypothetical protein
MPLVIPQYHAHVIESLRLADDPQDMAVTYGVEVEGAAAPTVSDLAESLATLFNTHVMPIVVSPYIHVNTHVEYQVGAPPAPLQIADRPSSLAGGANDTNITPQNSAHLIRKNTSLGGRRNRGRMYLPGVSEANVSNTGVLAPARVAQINTALSNWRAALEANTGILYMVILHGTSLNSPTPTPTPVTSLACQPVIATQRRRLR